MSDQAVRRVEMNSMKAVAALLAITRVMIGCAAESTEPTSAVASRSTASSCNEDEPGCLSNRGGSGEDCDSCSSSRDCIDRHGDGWLCGPFSTTCGNVCAYHL